MPLHYTSLTSPNRNRLAQISNHCYKRDELRTEVKIPYFIIVLIWFTRGVVPHSSVLSRDCDWILVVIPDHLLELDVVAHENGGVAVGFEAVGDDVEVFVAA